MKKAKRKRSSFEKEFEPTKKESKILFGVMKGKIKISKDFDMPLPDKILSEFFNPKIKL